MTATAERLLAALHARCRHPWTVMEVCGGQTHALLRYGIEQRLPPQLTLIHGPGCPVCVTASERIDQAIALAERPEVILCSYGDMLRVPGSDGRDLLSVRARGGAVRVIYAPLDVLAIARAYPQRRVVFLAVGFETTAPATALLAVQALQAGVHNLELLICHVRVPPVLDRMLGTPTCRVQAVLAAGHVCTVMGEGEYRPLVARHRRPIVITGFSAVELLYGIFAAVDQLENGTARLENAYPQAVRSGGNQGSQALLERVFEPATTEWRGLGAIQAGGYRLRPPFDRLTASLDDRGAGPPGTRSTAATASTERCLAGAVLQGLIKPHQCPHFGGGCTPEHPLGAPMVSSEGACAAYHRYRS
jgi:hydrogenase expression/formation protein HypD